ncbi:MULTISPECIES: hypothetical protein [Subtercola]|uniref:Uncharacterized protein n=1 Tax=Subtercola vilae TaxID=2056433 RepID=A0A4T2BPG7_9MICO|nr:MULTISPECIES: hypothetical protein [Subtercola]MEA9986007.1 hypothetical protein [Subtercola sp. RTI3]TIH33317.1 hypothetical protein D4765_15020 [Subtercola vilae]
MPSFRVTVMIGALKTGVAPPSLVPRAAAAARTLTTVEASDLAVVSGSARITVRFTGDDAAHAFIVADAVLSELRSLAEVVTYQVTRRQGGRWYAEH